MNKVVYKGKVAQNGNSESLRFEKTLFRSYPQFAQGSELLATPLADDVLLVRVNTPAKKQAAPNDPVMSVFLSFLENDMIAHPENITPVAQSEMNEIADLVDGVEFDE
ncbi:hypothetical protein MNBD_GAMMA10-1223 [hydrothermal vent metagenome]|uniref:Uncharacterized protein n=1 Tax=hydrothermal vent metagenome TaxID=652676 RepID=A0A3B0XS36_9ZZZZ